jgi:Fe-S cluster biogenesis protein NfuA
VEQARRDSSWEDILRICREILAPLVKADGGEMFLVAVTADTVHIHLSGACSGCPGVALTRDDVLTPAIQATMPKARVLVTTGMHAPPGATRVDVS